MSNSTPLASDGSSVEKKMATMELDPLFVKALKLLHSKSKESTDQLRDMLNEVLNKRKSRLDLKVSSCLLTIHNGI